MDFKQKIYDHYLKLIEDKILLLRNTLIDLKESGSNETKSTVGDKYETALAMLHIEEEKTRLHLRDALKQKVLFAKIDPSVPASKITIGSLVKTNKGYLFLSLALGRIVVNGITVMSLSPESPLGAKLMGLKINEVAEINGLHYIIESIS